MVGSPGAETFCSERKKDTPWNGHQAPSPILGLFKQHLENSPLAIYIPPGPVRRGFLPLIGPKRTGGRSVHRRQEVLKVTF